MGIDFLKKLQKCHNLTTRYYKIMLDIVKSRGIGVKPLHIALQTFEEANIALQIFRIELYIS